MNDAGSAQAVDAKSTVRSLARTMILIPAGQHTHCLTCSRSYQINLFIDAFRIDQVEVSNEEYQVCVDAGVCRKLPQMDEPELPVVGVTWKDADTFCRFAGARLPTAAEWRKAAYPLDPPLQDGFGPMISPKYDLCKVLVIGGISGEPCTTGIQHEKPDPISTKNAAMDQNLNEFDRAIHDDGIVFDLFGNVAEWVSDWYSLKEYVKPSTTRNPRGAAKGTEKLICGGSFSALVGLSGGNCRPMDPNVGYPDVGIRCARDAPSTDKPQEH